MSKEDNERHPAGLTEVSVSVNQLSNDKKSITEDNEGIPAGSHKGYNQRQPIVCDYYVKFRHTGSIPVKPGRGYMRGFPQGPTRLSGGVSLLSDQ